MEAPGGGMPGMPGMGGMPGMPGMGGMPGMPGMGGQSLQDMLPGLIWRYMLPGTPSGARKNTQRSAKNKSNNRKKNKQ